MTREPVSFEAPANELAFPFKRSHAARGVEAPVFFGTGEYETDASRDEEWNRGAYLAEGLGHCGACHTPRNRFGALETKERRTTAATWKDWHAPALNDRSPAPIPWSRDQLVDYLFRWLGGGSTELRPAPMAPVVNHLL